MGDDNKGDNFGITGGETANMVNALLKTSKVGQAFAMTVKSKMTAVTATIDPDATAMAKKVDGAARDLDTAVSQLKAKLGL